MLRNSHSSSISGSLQTPDSHAPDEHSESREQASPCERSGSQVPEASPHNKPSVHLPSVPEPQASPSWDQGTVRQVPSPAAPAIGRQTLAASDWGAHVASEKQLSPCAPVPTKAAPQAASTCAANSVEGPQSARAWLIRDETLVGGYKIKLKAEL